MHALVVDDSRTTRLILKALLGQLGYEVSEAASAREAFDHLARSPETALVLIDWNMPEVDGVAQGAQSTSSGAGETQKAAEQLARMAAELQELVNRFHYQEEFPTPPVPAVNGRYAAANEGTFAKKRTVSQTRPLAKNALQGGVSQHEPRRAVAWTAEKASRA